MNDETFNAPDRVIGRLSNGFGKVITIEGEVTPWKQPNAKSLEKAVLLRVHAVNGKALSEPCEIVARWFPTADSKKIFGKVNLVGYESGEFAGVPSDAFSYIMPVASQDFHFESFFIILKSNE
jgi:hypothetical protein